MTNDIKISMSKPPCYDDVSVAFGIRPQAYFTYGDTIHCVDVPPPPPDIIEHEREHMKQQLAMLGPDTEPTPENYIEGAELWWGKFLRDEAFRVDQEAKAYGKQFRWIATRTTNRQARFAYLQAFAQSLSGPLYNNSIDFMSAMHLIRQHSGIK